MEVTTAEALDASASQRVEKDLSEFLGKKVDLVKHVDADIIGGMIIRIGDMVYDTSVRQKLASIRTQTVESTAQQMRASLEQFATNN